MKPQEYQREIKKIKKVIKSLEDAIANLSAVAGFCHLPEVIRAATAEDIIPGAIIWYKEGDNGPFWNEVVEVHLPADLFCGYTADDGCRYGLDDAWVEVL